MKKIMMLITLLFLTGCSFTTETDYVVDEETKREIKDQLLEELQKEVQFEFQPDITELENMMVSVVENNSKAVIGVSNYQTTDGVSMITSTGSGVIYKLQGDYFYAITNEHVVDGSHDVKVVINNEEIVDAELIGADKQTDIAVVRFSYEGANEIKISKFGDSDALKRGQISIAIGNPLGYDYFGTVTMGVISGLSRGIDIDFDNDNIIDWKATLIQHDASISPGNSGGPLYNLSGEVIGINNMKIVESDVSNIGFAIPGNTAMRIAEVLEQEGRVMRPLLGITGQEVALARLNPDIDIPETITGGVYVDTIIDGGSVDGSGMQSGDIILEYNGMEIIDFDDLRASLNDSLVGDTITLTVYRDGENLTFDVILKERPE